MESLATVANLNISSWDIALLLILIGGGFLLGLFLGRNRIFLLLLGMYISYALLSVIPLNKLFPSMFQREEDFVILIVLFLVLIGLVFFLLSRSILKTSIRKKADKMILQSVVLSVFFIGAIISVVFSFFPKNLLSQFSDLALMIFDTLWARALWFIVPLIFIGLFKRKRR